MKKILIAILIGATAGIIDVIPMLIQNLTWQENLSAFLHWIALGILIPCINWRICPWLKGLLVAEITALPIAILMLKEEPIAALPILLFSAVLGSLVGIAGAKLIKN